MRTLQPSSPPTAARRRLTPRTPRMSLSQVCVVVAGMLGVVLLSGGCRGPRVQPAAALPATPPPSAQVAAPPAPPPQPSPAPPPPPAAGRAEAAEVAPELRDCWEQARSEVVATLPARMAAQETRLKQGRKVRDYSEGKGRLKQVAITIDDGPHPDYTPKILEILKEEGAVATFFVVGELAVRHPELIRAQVAAGNEVANHTYHHISLPRATDRQVAVELTACEAVIERIVGKSSHLYRPPGGKADARVDNIADALGLTTVRWTVNPADYRGFDQETVTSRVLRRVERGGIVLLHDGYGPTLRALSDILDTLDKRGYQFVTISQLMANDAS